MTRVSFLALVFALVLASNASASGPSAVTFYLEENGGGGVIAQDGLETPAGETFSWQTCTPGRLDCAPFASGQKAITTGVRPNTVFVVTPSDGPIVQSPTWLGDVRALTPPSVRGAVRANALVTPVAGRWSGGWVGDLNHAQLAECRYPNGTGCKALTGLGGPSCPHEAAVLDPALTGRYLRVADQVYASDSILESPNDVDSLADLGHVWPAAPITAVAMIGRIGPAIGARTDRCGRAPLALPDEPSARLSPEEQR